MPVLTVSEKTSPQLGFSRNCLICALLVHRDHAVFERVRHARERQRGQAGLFGVKVDDLREVEIGQRIAGDHHKRLLEHALGVLHAAGGAQRLILQAVLDMHAMRRTIAEVILDDIRKVLDGDDDLGDAMDLEQLDDVRTSPGGRQSAPLVWGG